MIPELARSSRFSGLRALAVSEERDLAGRVAGLMYLLASATVLLLPLVPGVPASDRPVLLAAAAVGALWGACCLYVIPWQRVDPRVSHLSSAMGLPITAATMAVTGGAHSPARFYLLFIVFYASYFYPPREALPHLIGCVLVLALPFAYDPSVIESGLLGETLILAPTFFVLGGLIMGGKRIMVDLSRHDPLTGLVNRRAFEQRLAAAAQRRRESDRFGLMLCDLDSFKDVNTHHGYLEGDRVLREAARALRSAVRADDLVARLGGDEFAIVVPGGDDAAMASLAERVCAALTEADGRLGLGAYRLTGSVGWTLFPDRTPHPERAVAAADVVMRRAKEDGKRCRDGRLRSGPAADYAIRTSAARGPLSPDSAT